MKNRVDLTAAEGKERVAYLVNCKNRQGFDLSTDWVKHSTETGRVDT
jgi:hypothetical protein